MKKITSDWFTVAETDLKTAKEVIDNPELTPAVAFHCHQCMEKCFKAVLVENNMEIPKIHNLPKLYALASKHLDIDLDLDQLNRINDVYIDSRYPNELGLLPVGIPSEKIVLSFVKTAEMIYNQAYKKYN